MKYEKIPNKILNLKLGVGYFKDPCTIKDELDRYPDIILDYKCQFKKGALWSFHAWSKDHVFFLMDDPFEPSEKIIVAIPRNPPKRKKK